MRRLGDTDSTSWSQPSAFHAAGKHVSNAKAPRLVLGDGGSSNAPPLLDLCVMALGCRTAEWKVCHSLSSPHQELRRGAQQFQTPGLLLCYLRDTVCSVKKEGRYKAAGEGGHGEGRQTGRGGRQGVGMKAAA